MGGISHQHTVWIEVKRRALNGDHGLGGQPKEVLGQGFSSEENNQNVKMLSWVLNTTQIFQMYWLCGHSIPLRSTEKCQEEHRRGKTPVSSSPHISSLHSSTTLITSQKNKFNCIWTLQYVYVIRHWHFIIKHTDHTTFNYVGMFRVSLEKIGMLLSIWLMHNKLKFMWIGMYLEMNNCNQACVCQASTEVSWKLEDLKSSWKDKK